LKAAAALLSQLPKGQQKLKYKTMKKVNPITARVKAKFAQLTKPTKEFSIGNINQNTEPAIAPSGHIGMVPQKAIPSMAKQTKSKAATESKTTESRSKSVSEASTTKTKEPVKSKEPVKGKEPVKETPKFTGKTSAELEAYIKKYKTEKNADEMNNLYEKELTSIKKTRALRAKPVRSKPVSRSSGSGYSSRSTPKAKAKAKTKAKAKAKAKTKKEKAESKDEEKASMAKNYASGYYGVGKDKNKNKKKKKK